MTKSDVAHRRLRNQCLAVAMAGEPADVVQWLGAVQAQEYEWAKWGLGLRLQGATNDTIENAFTAGLLLRTHVMRPTWHLVAPSDIRWMLALTAPRIIAGSAGRYRQLELEQDTLTRSISVLERALRDGHSLTRDALRDVLEHAKIATNGQRLPHILDYAELVGLVCSGPRQGKKHTYSLLEERVPSSKPLERDEALARLVLRYFSSHGPATLRDFTWWSGLTITDARKGLSMLESAIASKTVDGVVYWFSASAPDTGKTETGYPAVHLLPPFDEYTVGYQDRSAILDRSRKNSLALEAVILLHGRIVGVWQRALKKDTVVIEVRTCAASIEKEMEAMIAAAQRYGDFLGLFTTLTQA